MSMACHTSEKCSYGPAGLTVQDVSQALGAEQVLQSSHLILQVTHQLVVGVLVDHRVTLDVLGAVRVAVEEQRPIGREPLDDF